MKGIKKNLILILFIVLLLSISGCKNKKCKEHIDSNQDNICDKCKAELECKHNWLEATCDEPKKCSICKITEGSKLNHRWVEATYTTPKTCSVCDITEGEPLKCVDHLDENSDQLCDNCGAAVAPNIPPCEHNWIPATYTTPKTCSICGEIEGDPIYHEHKDDNEDNICEVCEQTIDKTSYRPKWVANKQTGGFNGNGMTIKILVYPIHQYDPFNENYIKEDKIAFQKQIRNIEKSYGIDLVFEEYPSIAVMHEARNSYIRTNFFNDEFVKNDIYIVNIQSTYITNLIKADALSMLYDYSNVSGLFDEIGYVKSNEGTYVSGKYTQDDLTKDLTSSLSYKAFGYVNQKLRPDYYIYFNEDLIKQAGLTNPAELWLKGEWTWDKFEEYCETLKSYYGTEKTVFEMSYADFIIGSYSAAGNKIATTRPSLSLVSTAMIEKFKDVQNMNLNKMCKLIDMYSGSIDFVNGNTVFTQAYLYRIDNPNKFNGYDINFNLGVVPYPTDVEQGGKPITTINNDEAIKDKDGNPIKLSENEYISSVDMTNSSYLIPMTTTECFSILNLKERKNNITDKILFAILYDLYESYEDEIDEDEKYRNELLEKFGSELYVETIMSVQNKKYFDLIETVSLNVGGGSHWSYNAFWSLSGRICSDTSLNPSVTLNEVLSEYKTAMSGNNPWIP